MLDILRTLSELLELDKVVIDLLLEIVGSLDLDELIELTFEIYGLEWVLGTILVAFDHRDKSE